MNKIKLEKILRNYKIIKSMIDTTNARIQAYTDAIKNPELIASWGFSNNNRELGMPGAPLRNTSSPVEREICDNELTIEIIKDWIEDDKSRIYRYKLQIDIIENSLQALTTQERYIIRMKYFEKMNWNNIELNFNNEFKQKNDITSEQTKKINAHSIDNLLKIFIPLENIFI